MISSSRLLWEPQLTVTLITVEDLQNALQKHYTRKSLKSNLTNISLERSRRLKHYSFYQSRSHLVKRSWTFQVPSPYNLSLLNLKGDPYLQWMLLITFCKINTTVVCCLSRTGIWINSLYICQMPIKRYQVQYNCVQFFSSE